MNTVELKEVQRQFPVFGRADVIVVGAGIAGISAAVNVARNGKTVILLEKSILTGGLATAGHVCIYLALDDGLGHKIFGGFAEELLHTSIKYGYNTLPGQWTFGVKAVEEPEERYQTHFNIPAGVMAFDELLEENNVQVVFDALFC